MEIAIKSETDSRILVYPLIKVLSSYGTVAVYTNSNHLIRLIEDEEEGGFRNIRIIVDNEGDLEKVKREDNFNPSRYDYIIYDNMGATSYDLLIIMLTNRLSEQFMTDILYIVQDEKVHFLKFGAPAPTSKGAKDKAKKIKPRKGEEEVVIEEDDNFNKWHVEKTDEEVLKELIEGHKSKWIKFPSFGDIEMCEARHILPVPGDDLIKELYRLFSPYLNIDERMFTKGARVKDEGCSTISGADVR